MHEKIHDADVSGHFCRGDQAGKNKIPRPPERLGFLLETCLPRSSTDQKKLNCGKGLQNVWRSLEQVVMPLQLKKSGYLADLHIGGPDAHRGSQRRVVPGAEKGLQLEPAPDAGVLFW